jgi:hypothetical protein
MGKTIFYVYLACLSVTVSPVAAQEKKPAGEVDRTFWVETMVKIADPVLTNLSRNTLKENMPFESLSSEPLRKQVSCLEAVGRLICGIAPWLELGPDETPEGQLRKKYIGLAVKGLENAVNPQSPDYLIFDNRHSQPLVDAAFLAEGLLRAPGQLWGNLSSEAKEMMITELKRSRSIKPYESNWLLFASTVEAAILEFTGECDVERLTYGVERFRDDWYKGDGWYGDGAPFHADYYNSFVIHPMLTDVLVTMKKHHVEGAGFLDIQLKRAARFASIQERLISPEGSYPVVGRSIVYRFGAFHALAQACLMDILPDNLPAAQVRCALTAVIRNQISPDNFDGQGWLKVGFAGAQINMSESYINTGSVYLCSMGMLALGLSPDHPFWSGPYTEWTNLKAWKGIDVGADSAMRE